MAQAGVKSAILNVKINLGSIKDDEFVERISFEIDELQKNADDKTNEIMKIVENSL